ncbi:MAG: SH3 domain-containing protein [Planctomycetota bacterium]
MRRKVLMGGWYAIAIAGLLVADEYRVTIKEAFLFKEPDPWAETAGSIAWGKTVTTTGAANGDFYPVKGPNGETGWIAKSDVQDPKDFEAGTAGTKNDKGAQEGAYVKGFDPEVEDKAKADDATLAKYLAEEVLPLVWDTRGSKAVEDKEEDIERFVLKHPLNARGEKDPNLSDAENANLASQWKHLNEELIPLKQAVEPIRSKWQAELRAFRQSGQIGEFAGRK